VLPLHFHHCEDEANEGVEVSAGSSAAQQAARLSAVARSHQLEAQRAADEAGRYAAAAIAERKLAQRLSPLTAHGYHLLADRQWPGSKNAQLDLIVVGPSGLWIVDSKHWTDFEIAAGHLFRGQADVTDDVMRLADVANAAEEAFVELGLAPGEIRVVLAMEGRKGKLGDIGPIEVVGADDIQTHMARRGKRLTTNQVELVLGIAMQYFPSYAGAQQERAAAVVPEPVLDELPETLLDEGALLSEAEVREALTEAELAAPIEDWMTFLHPEQAALVRRTFNGPARIRGAAGTGKTVVGLHRAAYLARVHPQGKILVTTFVRTLPAVLSSLLERMAPDVANRVEFVNVHALATRIARARGVALNPSARRANELLKAAWAGLAPDHLTRLSQRAGGGLEYWKEEVEAVIKGRGLSTFDEYADCKRPGRLVRLNIEDRRAVWALFQAYDTALRAENVHDFHDVVLLAEKAVETSPAQLYDAVIIDEAQDLSLAMIRLLHAVVGDAADSFTLIGDGQQNIYPGGYVLSEAGISLAGRGVVLERNYRNTIEVQEYAAQLIAESTYIDIDDECAPETASEISQGPIRHGARPVVSRFRSKAEHDAGLLAALRDLTVGSSIGDAAILCNTTWEADAATRLLVGAGIPSISLLEYKGTPVDAVKVGTIKRAKGLEFKVVMLPWTLTSTRGLDEERVARDVRERYVAATRARDALWVGSH
jgi:hypothetical protein